MFIDVHCHLDSNYYNDIDKVINNAKKNAEKLLKSFFNNNKKYKDYEVEFKWEK